MSCCCADTSNPKGIARLLVRIAFGLSLVFMGIAHYQDPQFAESVGRGLGSLEVLGMAWGYILPALYIVGGVLLTLGLFMNVAAWVTGIALISIPTGLLLKSVFGISLNDTMPLALTGWVWILVYMFAVKGGCSHWMANGDGCACCTDGSCACDCHGAKMSKSTVSKSAPAKPVVMAKAPMKKAAPKKK